eukprot:evm.model.scf_828EXC.2 EVM.evm.TU.scf_828EXC.2   scf_828EXC:17612-20263(+)
MPDEVAPAQCRPAKWPIGPPAPKWCTWFVVRFLWLAVLVLMSVWLSAYCDGFGVKKPEKIFSWHPLLMTIVFAVFMTESVLMYRAWGFKDSLLAKWLHGSLHTCSVVLVALAWVAVFKYHNSSRHIPNLYSVHSYLGITTTALLVFQWLVGVMSFGWPRMKDDHRAAYTPVHVALGLGVYFTGLATMLVGIQQKTTFEQFSSKSPGHYEHVMTFPAATAVVIVLLGISVGYHFAQSASDRYKREQAPLLAEDAA